MCACVSLYAVPVLCGRQVGGTNFLKCTRAASPARHRAKEQEGRKRDEVTAVVLPVAPSPFFFFFNPTPSCDPLLCWFHGQDAGAAAF